MILHRSIPLARRSAEPAAAAGGTAATGPKLIPTLFSTPDAMSRGRYVEILDHGPGAVNVRAKSLLFHHNPNDVVGGLKNISVQASGVRGDVFFASTARGQEVATLYAEDCVDGVSVGYDIEEYTITEMDDGRCEIRATKWSLLELSVTPIAVDATAGLGRSDDPASIAFLDQLTQRASARSKDPMSTPAAPAAAIAPAPAAAPAAVVPTTTPTEPLPGARALPELDPVEIARHAETLGLRASDYLGHADWQTRMLADIGKRAPATAPVAANITITTDERDNIDKEAVDAMISRRGFSHGFRALSRRMGMPVEGGRDEIAKFLFSRASGGLSGRAAEVSANFPRVASLASGKLVLDAFNKVQNIWPLFCNEAYTNDFKTFQTAGLQIADFAAVAEGAAAGDLTIDDAGGSGTLSMRGGAIELTLEAYYNDDGGQFMRLASNVGGVAARHLDRLACSTLAAMSFAGQSGVLPFTAANLKTTWANYIAMTGPAGDNSGIAPSRIIVPGGLYIDALETTTVASGEATKRIFAEGGEFLRPVNARYLADANDWYLVADPAEAPVVTILRHNDFKTPNLKVVDPGLVSSWKWLIQFPAAGIPNYMGAGATKPLGAYKQIVP